MNNLDISIVIPTYNRNDKLNALIQNAFNALPENVKLLVIDNCSDVPVADTLKENNLLSFPRLKVIRNSVNIGMAANIIECFKKCETEWMWLMSDDDIILDHSFGRIQKTLLEVMEECVYVNFGSSIFERNSSFYAAGVEELISTMDSFKNLLFISAGCYRVSAFRNSIRIGYQYAYSMAPHVAMLLTAVVGGRSAYFSSDKVVDQGFSESNWSVVNFQLVKNSLLEVPLPEGGETFKKFATLLSSDRSGDEMYFYQLLYISGMKPDARMSYFFKRIIGNNSFSKLSIRAWIKRKFLLFFIQFPGLIRYYLKIRSRYISSQKVPHMLHNRI